MRRVRTFLGTLAALAAVVPLPARGQASDAVRAVAAPLNGPVRTRAFGELAEGPYERLVIRGALVRPGHGGPPAGPYDIVIRGNVIEDMIPFDPVTAERRGDTERPTGDRVIDATGMVVMPGMIDLHMHLREDPQPLEYVYYTKLAHGVTTLVPAPDRGLDAAMSEAEKSARNEILAPRMYPIWGWGDKLEMSRAELEDPANAGRIARLMAEITE